MVPAVGGGGVERDDKGREYFRCRRGRFGNEEARAAGVIRMKWIFYVKRMKRE